MSKDSDFVAITVMVHRADLAQFTEYAEIAMPKEPHQDAVSRFFLMSAKDAVNKDVRGLRSLLPSQQKNKGKPVVSAKPAAQTSEPAPSSALEIGSPMSGIEEEPAAGSVGYGSSLTNLQFP